MAGNIFDTIVPHFLRSLDRSLIRQLSPWGFVRDWWFECYQLNLLMICGVVGWIVVLVVCGQLHGRLPAGHRAARVTAVGAVILLGVGCHFGRDHWGLAHICLQPLAEISRSYNPISASNYVIKTAADWRFVGDVFAETQFIPIIVAGVTLALAMWNIRRQSGGIGRPPSATSP